MKNRKKTSLKSTKDRSTMWAPSSFIDVRDRLSSDTGLSKEEVCLGIGKIVDSDYDQYRKNIRKIFDNEIDMQPKNKKKYDWKKQKKGGFFDDLRF